MSENYELVSKAPLSSFVLSQYYILIYTVYKNKQQNNNLPEGTENDTILRAIFLTWRFHRFRMTVIE